LRTTFFSQRFSLGLANGDVAYIRNFSTRFSPEEAIMTTRASGPFDVKVIPQTADDGEAGSFGRMFLDKKFHGDLDAVSKGQMLSAGSPATGSAGYVALERVSGALHGRRGSFVLQHNGSMNRGVPSLTVTVVPDSGTEELAGLEGSMTIIREPGKHSYEFDYTIAAPPDR
jgi:hypothetical protein